MEKKVSAKIEATMNNIKEIVDVSTIVGDPIIAGETTIIPVSKVNYGFASGGTDLPGKTEKELFAGGGGAGVTLQPLAFLVISGSNVKILEISTKYNDGLDRALTMAPDIIDKVKDAVASFTNKGE